MRLIPLPAFQDNSLWFLHDGRRALDPGDAQPVLEALQREGLELEAILVTRHHPDHDSGVDVLRNTTRAKVCGRALHSLEKLAALRGETRVCCTHEYTLSNPRLAQAVEPGNLQLINFTLQANPFLRTRAG